MSAKSNYKVSDEVTKSLQAIDSMSGRIRYLDRAGHSRYAIAKILSDLYPRDGNGVRYQWVRNVLEQKVRKS